MQGAAKQPQYAIDLIPVLVMPQFMPQHMQGILGGDGQRQRDIRPEDTDQAGTGQGINEVNGQFFHLQTLAQGLVIL